MAQCPSVVMQQLHAVCKQGFRGLKLQASNCASNASRSSSLKGTNRHLRQPHLQQQQANATCAGSQPLQCQQQLEHLHPWLRALRSRVGSSLQQPGTILQLTGRLQQQQGAGNAIGSLSSRLRYFASPCLQNSRVSWMRCNSQQFGPIKPLYRQVSRAFSSNSGNGRPFAAAALRISGRATGSGWRPWLQQQLSNCSSSSSWSVQLQLSRSSAAAAAGLAAYRAAAVAASNAAAAAQLAAALRRAAGMSSSALSARAAAAGWWDGWALWVNRSPGFLLSSLLNALNLVGNKLPMALGLLLVDMTHNSPLFSGSQADSLQQPYLPDQVPAFYANGGPAGSDQKLQRSQISDHRSVTALVQGFWSEALEAASAGARLIWLGVIWLPAAITAPVVLTWGFGRSWWLVLLRVSLEASGPAFIKWGQWAATRHDLFAQDVCAALEELHTNAPAHSFRYTCTQLRNSFSLPTSELFDWIEEVPIACGSIGQVHRGRFSEKGAALTGCKPGELVAIKVRHPGVSEAIERDFQTMVWLARIAGKTIPAAKTLRLDETLKQFAAPLHEQVDLSREAANLQKFNKNFKRTRRVSFPLPLYPLVSPDVLVESFEPGRHISYYIAAEGNHPYRSRLAELGSGTMLQMILVDNLIHSDLHPGNILVRLEPPRGFLGLAHKALTHLANPDGAAMRTIARGLATLQEQQLKSDQPDQIDLKWDQIRSRDHLDQASTISNLGPDLDQSEKAVDSGHTKFTKWYDVRQQWLMLRGAAADPAAAVGKLQDLLHEITASWLQPHLVLLDVGMATELSPEDQNNMIGLFRAFVGLDGANVANWTLRFSGSDQACPKPQEFIDDMQATFDTLKKTIAANEAAKVRWKAAERRQQRQQQQQQQEDDDDDQPSSSETNGSAGDGSSTVLVMPEQFDSGAEALATVLELVRLHSVSLPGHICAVVVTTLILEGWSNKLAPEHSVLSQVRGMFSPAMYNWHDRMDSVVDIVMDRGDTALLLT